MTNKQILDETKAFLIEEGFTESDAEDISKILAGRAGSIRLKMDEYLEDKHGIDT